MTIDVLLRAETALWAFSEDEWKAFASRHKSPFPERHTIDDPRFPQLAKWALALLDQTDRFGEAVLLAAPCPICKADVEIAQKFGGGVWWAYAASDCVSGVRVECQGCGTSGPIHSVQNVHVAVRGWNRLGRNFSAANYN